MPVLRLSPPLRPLAMLCCALLLGSSVGALAWGALPSGILAAPARVGLDEDSAAAAGGAYLCPPGGEAPVGGGVCARRFSGAFDYMVEPDLAVSPGDPGVMAIAANNGQSVDGLAPLLAGSPELRTQTFALLVTRDGGATWSAVDLPAAPPAPAPVTSFAVADTQYWDPMVRFDDDGTLHVVGVLVWQGADGSGKQRRIFHVATDDLGASWGAYTLLGQRVDKPMVTVEESGAMSIAWWETRDTTLGFARSLDGGATWAGLDPRAPRIPCYMPSTLAEHDGSLVVACSRDERFAATSTAPPTGIYRYDATANAFRLQGTLGPTSIPFLLAPPDGSLLIVAGVWNVSDVLLARSTDGGATWASLPQLGARLETSSAWTFLQFMGGRVDPWGNVQVFVRGVDVPPRPDIGPAGPYVDLPLFLAAANADEFAVAHVVLDAASGAVLSEQLLTPALSHAPDGPPSAAPGRAGDYYGMAFAGDRTVLVWEYQRSLYLTHWMS